MIEQTHFFNGCGNFIGMYRAYFMSMEIFMSITFMGMEIFWCWYDFFILFYFILFGVWHGIFLLVWNFFFFLLVWNFFC